MANDRKRPVSELRVTISEDTTDASKVDRETLSNIFPEYEFSDEFIESITKLNKELGFQPNSITDSLSNHLESFKKFENLNTVNKYKDSYNSNKLSNYIKAVSFVNLVNSGVAMNKAFMRVNGKTEATSKRESNNQQASVYARTPLVQSLFASTDLDIRTSNQYLKTEALFKLRSLMNDVDVAHSTQEKAASSLLKTLVKEETSGVVINNNNSVNNTKIESTEVKFDAFAAIQHAMSQSSNIAKIADKSKNTKQEILANQAVFTPRENVVEAEVSKDE